MLHDPIGMQATAYGHPQVVQGSVRLVNFRFRLQHQEDTCVLLGYSARPNFCNRDLPPTGMIVKGMEVQRGTTKDFEVPIQLDAATIAVLEEARGDGDVTAHIHLDLLLWRASGARMESSGTSVTFEISTQRWLKILSELGHGEIQLVELRRPHLPPQSRLDGAFARLRKAEEQLRQGENEGAVTSCREAFEAADAVFGKKPLETALASFIDRDSLGNEDGYPAKSARYDTLRGALRNLLNMGPHDKYHISRADAEVLVYASLALMAFFARKLREQEATMP